MKRSFRVLRAAAVCLGLAALTLSSGTSAQMQDDEMSAMMMTLMGGGIETPMDETAPAG